MAKDIHHFQNDMTDQTAVYWITRSADPDVEWDERVSIMKGLQAHYGSHEKLLTEAERVVTLYGKKSEPDPFEDLDDEL